ncbi:MAG: hypothetical protein WCC64_17445 [Aliidongia sp.]
MGKSFGSALLATSLALWVPIAGAQVPGTPPEPPSVHQPSVIPPSRDVPGDPEAPISLSRQLGNSHGVITPPPNVDPTMAKPAPDLGPQSMPIIPPPGTADNQPDVQPR